MTSETPRQGFKRFIPPTARILMGLIFFVFGGLYFVHPPTAEDMKGIPQAAIDFGMALGNTHYMFPLIKVTEVIVGLLLLFNRFVPLALVLIAPNIVNILFFHAFLEPKGLPIAVVILVLELYLTWKYRDAYRAMFTPKATPHS
jgi:uncharacterized membrane protein YphA (DoxX/SURF4 family)